MCFLFHGLVKEILWIFWPLKVIKNTKAACIKCPDWKISSHTLKNLPDKEKEFFMEFALHGLAEYSQLSKKLLDTGMQFKDLLVRCLIWVAFSAVN
jgi:hypothetical protein